jgi:small-conductance mechanosensitive channel
MGPVPCRLVYRHALGGYSPPVPRMSLFMDIGQGAGLAGATGVRPFLPPLLAGALARGDLALDFDGSGWSFLESPAFLAVVFALAVAAYVVERAAASAVRRPLELALAVLGATLGGLLAAGSLAEGGESAVLGLVIGVLCAVLAWVAIGGILERARQRLGEGAGMLDVFADGAALLLAAVAILVPPLSFLALIGFVVLLVRGRGQTDRKYAGLRILR